MKLSFGILLYLVLLPINLIMAFVACMLAPILPVFASKEGWLPRCLWWFQTPDASLDGDSGWRNASKHPYVNKLPRYLRQVLWLWRNPSYGFNWTVLATRPLPATWSYLGNIECDRSLLKTSWVLVRCGIYFHFRIYIKYPLINRCIQLNMGWNMHLACKSNTQTGMKAKYRFTPHPFRIMP